MKLRSSIIWIALILFSCSGNEKELSIDNAIYGTWELVEKIQSGNDGLPAWLPVNEYQFYTLNISENGIISHSKYDREGTYQLISPNILQLNINDDQGSLQAEYKYELE